MEAYQAYILISVLVLALIAFSILFMSRRKPEQGLSKLAALSFACIIAGIIFGEDRLIGYSLLGLGLLLAVVDIWYKLTSK